MQGFPGSYVDSRIFKQADGRCLLLSPCYITFLHENVDIDTDSAVVFHMPTCASLEHADHCCQASYAQQSELQVPSVSVDANMVEV